MMLETVAAVPGMSAGMLLHLKSLRLVEPSGGWIRTLLEEAENERMHLMTFMHVSKPKWYERALIFAVQVRRECAGGAAGVVWVFFTGWRGQRLGQDYVHVTMSYADRPQEVCNDAYLLWGRVETLRRAGGGVGRGRGGRAEEPSWVASSGCREASNFQASPVKPRCHQ